jgi:hypothetical protein
MKTNRRASTVLLLIVFGLTAAETAQDVRFPEDYKTWQHVKSVVLGEGPKIFHFYANPQAVEGYRAGKFPNGSILVRETLQATAGAGDSKGVLTERTALDVMIKNDRAFAETGGWGFDTFDAKKAGASPEIRARCYACHVKQKGRDSVFTALPSTIHAGTPYPDGYRNWTFLHTSMVPATFDAFRSKPCEKPCSAGMFHFYANEKAMQGLRTNSYPDGAMIAEEMLEWLSDSKGAKEGARRLVGVMVKDSQRYSSTGGWG